MEDIKKIFNEEYIDPDYLKFIKGKDVVILGPGSNSLHVPDCNNLVNNFDVVVYASMMGGEDPADNRMARLQKLHPDLLGDRIDVFYRDLGDQRIRPEHALTEAKKISESELNLKYYITRNQCLSNPANKYHFKHSHLSDEWHINFQETLWKQVSEPSRKMMQTGQCAIYHLLTHQPKSLYILGYNFHTRGTLEGYYEEGHCAPITPKLRLVDSKVHSMYLAWRTVKIVYDLFDNVDGDPIFKEIMAMNDKEYVQANSLNVGDGERMALFNLSQYHRTYGPDEPFTVSGPTKEEVERLMGRTVNYESGLD